MKSQLYFLRFSHDAWSFNYRSLPSFIKLADIVFIISDLSIFKAFFKLSINDLLEKRMMNIENLFEKLSSIDWKFLWAELSFKHRINLL